MDRLSGMLLFGMGWFGCWITRPDTIRRARWWIERQVRASQDQQAQYEERKRRAREAASR